MKVFQCFVAFVFIQAPFWDQNGAFAQQLITNGTFQEGGYPSLNSWSYNSSSVGVSQQHGCIDPNGYGAEFFSVDASGSAFIEQAVNFPNSGTCDISFEVIGFPYSSQNAMNVIAYLDGQKILSKKVPLTGACEAISLDNFAVQSGEAKSFMIQAKAREPNSNRLLVSDVSLILTPTPPSPPKPPIPTPVSHREFIYANAVASNNTQQAAQFVTSVNSVVFVSAITPQWELLEEAFEEKSHEKDVSLVAGSGLNPLIASSGKFGHEKDGKYHFWIAGDGSYIHQDKFANSSAFHAESGAGFLGFDVSLDRNIIGVGTGYDYSHVKHDKSPTYSNQNQSGIATYYGYFGDDWNACLSVFGGFNITDSFRSLKQVLQNSFAQSSYMTWVLSEHFDCKFPCFFKNRWFSLQSKIGANYATSWRQSYKEKGEGNFLTLQPSQISGFISVKGDVLARQYFQKELFDVVFEQALGWNYHRSFNPGSTTVSLIGIGPSSVVPSNANIQNLFTLGLKVLFKSKKLKRPNVSLDYNLAKGSKYYFFSGRATISLSF